MPTEKDEPERWPMVFRGSEEQVRKLIRYAESVGLVCERIGDSEELRRLNRALERTSEAREELMRLQDELREKLRKVRSK